MAYGTRGGSVVGSLCSRGSTSTFRIHARACFSGRGIFYVGTALGVEVGTAVGLALVGFALDGKGVGVDEEGAELGAEPAKFKPVIDKHASGANEKILVTAGDQKTCETVRDKFIAIGMKAEVRKLTEEDVPSEREGVARGRGQLRVDASSPTREGATSSPRQETPTPRPGRVGGAPRRLLPRVGRGH